MCWIRAVIVFVVLFVIVYVDGPVVFIMRRKLVGMLDGLSVLTGGCGSFTPPPLLYLP